MSSPLPQTLGELQSSKEFYEARLKKRSIKDELRENLIHRLSAGETSLPGIVGFDDTVIPEVERAILAGHDVVEKVRVHRRFDAAMTGFQVEQKAQ